LKKYIKNCRAKRRNMERMTLACGGQAMNTFEDMDESCLGYAGAVYEHVLGENKFTFVEECKNPSSVTILLRAGNKHTLTQMKVCMLFDIYLRPFFNPIPTRLCHVIYCCGDKSYPCLVGIGLTHNRAVFRFSNRRGVIKCRYSKQATKVSLAHLPHFI
jgi:hypothetical protein